MSFYEIINELRRRFAYADSFDEFDTEAERALDAYVAGVFDAAAQLGITPDELDHIVRCA
ncbi:MAG: hypothetical protein IKF14_13210 [Atopobiaceae bacterium]|nr:hypothetical protein [Atopobiaceae bacterium]